MTKEYDLIYKSFTVTLPASKEMTDQITAGSPMPAAFGGIMLASMVVGVLISCIYPVLTLVLLNRPQVRDWFANQPD